MVERRFKNSVTLIARRAEIFLVATLSTPQKVLMLKNSATLIQFPPRRDVADACGNYASASNYYLVIYFLVTTQFQRFRVYCRLTSRAVRCFGLPFREVPCFLL